MIAVDTVQPARGTSRLRIALGILQLFISLGGLAGGWGLVSDPSGANLGMNVEPLANSPFPDYLVPGLFLLTVNGLGHLIAGILTLRRAPHYGDVAAGLGLFLMLWIVAQVYWIGLESWLQPLYLAFGILELALGVLARRVPRDDARPNRGTP